MLTDVEIEACRTVLALHEETIEWICDLKQPVLLVGESPAADADARLPLFPGPSGTIGDRLRSIVGLSRDTYLGMFERVNLLGRTIESWPAQEAVYAAWRVLEVANGRPVILLGARVAQAVSSACSCSATPPAAFEWFDLGPVAGGSPAIRIPHPSGVCQAYGSESVRRRAALVIADAFRRALPRAAASLRDLSGEKARQIRSSSSDSD